MRVRLYRVAESVSYHRDLHCPYLDAARRRDTNVTSFLIDDPGRGEAVPFLHHDHALALRACLRCAA